LNGVGIYAVTKVKKIRNKVLKKSVNYFLALMKDV